MKEHNILGVILAGGKSSRFGSNKSLSNLSNIKLPFNIQLFGYVLTTDEKYVIIFGGWDQAIWGDGDDIYIWNLESMEFRKSEKKCPTKSQFHACIMGYQVDDLLVHGYLRMCSKDDIEYLPQDIVKLVGHWCCNDFLHLFMSTRG